VGGESTDRPPDNENELIARRRAKLAQLREQGDDPFSVTGFSRTHLAREVRDSFGSLEGGTVRVAGRLMARRRHGRATFADLRDGSGAVQLLFRVDQLGPERYQAVGALDDGDIVGA
jgi:lysyl-tRNA synthetase class 2